MKLLSVTAKNFRCFAELELDLNVDGLVAVVGPNGAGKSTLFGAIEWGLYGGSRGRGPLPARRDGCPEGEPCFVEVEFEVAGRAYRARRVDRKDAQLIDLATDQPICTGLEETSRQVATRLGLTREMFCGTFYARQREVQALDSSDEVRRRGQVELLLGIERLRRATAHAQTAVKEQRHVVAALEAGAPDVDALRAEAERIQREAEHAAPAVQAAEQRVERARTGRDQAREQLDALRAQEREMLGRRGRAQAAQVKAEQARQSREALHGQVTEAEAAEKQLAELAPLADQAESLAVQERQMDLARVEHERAAALREQQHRALATAARLADQLAQLANSDDRGNGEDAGNGNGGLLAEPEALRAQIEAADERIDTLRGQQRTLGEERGELARQIETLDARLKGAERAAVLDGQLAELPAAEHTLETALERWHELNAQHAQLAAAIQHDTEHRDAVLAGTEEAACPTCKRPYDSGELDEIVAGYERDLQAATQRLADLDRELAELKTLSAKARRRAEALRALSAERRALGDDVPVDEQARAALREELERLGADARAKQDTEARAEAELKELVHTKVPELRARERASEELRRRIADLDAQRVQAEREARGYGERLADLKNNGYDPQAHTRVRTQLAEAQAADHRCAALRGKADGLELLRRRLAEQEAAVVAAAADEARLQAAVAEVVVDAEALKGAEEACSAADAEYDAAHAALIDANRQASADSDAVAAAHARLQQAREQAAKLRDECRELRVRSEVADALSAFREDASRRARPTLEQETGLLLGQVTRGRYNAVELNDSYQLQIADGRQLHPLRRYSGGEQDLAGLCLRLALSRTLARQRGAETGFVLLDEVFGSQDADRRRALLEQLHAIADAEFRQVFVVSHTDDVVEHCDLTIEVSRDDDGVSRAVGPRH
jgi:DNA repair protein SbcC/Rad50